MVSMMDKVRLKLNQAKRLINSNNIIAIESYTMVVFSTVNEMATGKCTGTQLSWMIKQVEEAITHGLTILKH